jgi:hypothetical protein
MWGDLYLNKEDNQMGAALLAALATLRGDV